MTHPAEAFLAPLAQHTVDRRGFLTFAAKGLALAFVLPAAGRIGSAIAAPTPAELAGAYVRIGTDGSITLAFGGAEMGQGAKSGLAQILAEELMVDWGQISVVQSLVDPVVSYLTGGSSAVRGRYATLRNAGAAARELLIAAAMAAKGDADRNNYKAASAKVTHVPSGTEWPYSALSTAAATLPVPADLRLTDPAKFRLIGQRVPRVDIPEKTDGSAKFGIDVWFPDMVFAAIRHCPTLGGTLAATPAKPSGAIALVPCKASDTRGAVTAGTTNAFAVVASNTWLAMKLAKSVSATWTLPASTAGIDSAQILAQAKALARSGPALVAEPAPPTGQTPASYAAVVEPQVAAALGTPTLDATYTLPYVAHATMEVLNCTVNVTFSGAAAQKCEIWAPTQSSATVANLAKTLTGLPLTQIVVHTTLLGGGLGRKFEMDYVSQAIQVALAVKKPVKLTWRREEDMANDQYRPCAVVNVKATLDSGKRIQAWSYRNVSQSILGQRGLAPAGRGRFAGGRRVGAPALCARDEGRRVGAAARGRPRGLLAVGRVVDQRVRRRVHARRARDGGGRRSVRVPVQPPDRRAEPGGDHGGRHALQLAQVAARGACVGDGVRGIVRHARVPGRRDLQSDLDLGDGESRRVRDRLRHRHQPGLGRGADAGRHPARTQRRAVGPVDVRGGQGRADQLQPVARDADQGDAAGDRADRQEHRAAGRRRRARRAAASRPRSRTPTRG